MNKSYKKRAFFLCLFLGTVHPGSDSPVFGQFYGASLTVAQQNNQQGYEADQRGDKVEALRLYRLACEGGDSFGCSNLGIQFHNGTGVAQNSKEAIRLYQLALKIDPNNTGAEQNLYLLGGLSQRQIDAANAAAKRAAEAAVVKVAEAAAGYDAHMRGDFSAAAEKYKIACDGSVSIGCSNLGILYHNGQGVPKDLSKAVSLYELALKLDPNNEAAKRDLLIANGKNTAPLNAASISNATKSINLSSTAVLKEPVDDSVNIIKASDGRVIFEYVDKKRISTEKYRSKHCIIEDKEYFGFFEPRSNLDWLYDWTLFTFSYLSLMQRFGNEPDLGSFKTNEEKLNFSSSFEWANSKNELKSHQKIIFYIPYNDLYKSRILKVDCFDWNEPKSIFDQVDISYSAMNRS